MCRRLTSCVCKKKGRYFSRAPMPCPGSAKFRVTCNNSLNGVSKAAFPCASRAPIRSPKLPKLTKLLNSARSAAAFCYCLKRSGVNLHRIWAVTTFSERRFFGEKRQLMKVIRFLLKGVVVLVGLAILGLIGFYIYLSTRPTPKTIKAAGIISVPAASSFPLKFIDYMFVSGSKLYAGYTSQGVVAVIDTASNQVVTEIGALPRSHGIAVAGDHGFATASGDDTVGIFDVSNNQLLKKIPGGVGPDAIIYDDKVRLIYVADHAGKTGTLIDPVMMSAVGTVQLGGVAEYAQADPQSGLIYQNLQDISQLVVVDPQKQMVTQRYYLGDGKNPSGLAYDAG